MDNTKIAEQIRSCPVWDDLEPIMVKETEPEAITTIQQYVEKKANNVLEQY